MDQHRDTVFHLPSLQTNPRKAVETAPFGKTLTPPEIEFGH